MRYIKVLCDETTLAETLAEYTSHFEEDYEEVLADGNSELMRMFDNGEDLGVGAYKETPTVQLQKELGMSNQPDSPFPFFNPFYKAGAVKYVPHIGDKEFSSLKHPEDIERAESMDYLPFLPRWHQYCGLVAMIARFIENKNVLLADGVGVGKTLQGLMLFAWLRFAGHSMGEQTRIGMVPNASDVFLRQRRWSYSQYVFDSIWLFPLLIGCSSQG